MSWRKIAAMCLLSFHLILMAIYSWTPQRIPFVIRNYSRFFFYPLPWNLFAPDPGRVNSLYWIEFETRDGKKTLVKGPRPTGLSSWEQFTYGEKLGRLVYLSVRRSEKDLKKQTRKDIVAYTGRIEKIDWVRARLILSLCDIPEPFANFTPQSEVLDSECRNEDFVDEVVND